MTASGWKWIEQGTDFFWPASLELLFAATLVLLMAMAINLGLCRAAASVRHRVWALTMGGLLLLPLLCPLLPKSPIPLSIPITATGPVSLTPERIDESAVAAPRQEGQSPEVVALPTVHRFDQIPPRPSSASSPQVRATSADPHRGTAPTAETSSWNAPSLLVGSYWVLMLLWMLGTGLCLVAMARSLWAERRLAKSAFPPDDPSWQALLDEIGGQLGVRRAVAVGVSQQSEVPLTIGWCRPKILLPPDCSHWTAAKRRVVLIHELSHVARHDVLWQVVARLACTVYWFHPLAWLADRRLRVERELACDDAVLRFGGQPDQYATVLLDVAAAVCHRLPTCAAAVAMARHNSVERRIRAILQPGLSRLPVGPRTGKLTLLGALILVVLTAALHPFAPPPQLKADSSKSETVAAADPLPAQAAVRLGTARYRHGSRIESMAVSADGRLAAVSCGVAWFSGLFLPAQVFDLTDGRCLYSLPNERGSYTEAVGLSPDGTTLATKDGKFLYFRDAATGKELRKLNYLPDSGGSRSITNWMTFTPDGKQIAATLLGHATCLIDVETAKVTKTFATGGAASACVFSPDGKVMAIGGYDLENGFYFVRLFEVGPGKELRRFPAARFPAGNGVKRALAFSPDGATLAGGGWGDARLRLWETATGKEPKVFPKIGEDIVSVAFAPDGKTVAAAADSIYWYDPDTGKERLRIKRRARTLAFSGDGSVLTGAVSGAIYRWDAASGRQLTPAEAQDSAVEQILVTADGRGVFTTDQDGDLYLWDAAGGKSPRRIEEGVKLGVVASLDRRFLAWTVRDVYGNSRIRLYDVAAERSIDRFPIIGGEATVAAFLPDGKSLLTLEGGPATFRLWDVESGKERRSFTVVPPKSVGDPGSALVVVPFCTPRRAALSPDGKTLAIGPDFPEGFRTEDGDLPVRLWDVATGKAGPELNKPTKVVDGSREAGSGTTDMWRWRSHQGTKSMDGRAFSPDGRFLVDWAENPFGRSRIDHVYVWDAATGRAVATLAAGPWTGAANAAFAPDGRTLATASADGIVRLWEVATWTVRAEFRGHRDRVTALAFGPDGRLFTGGLDTVVLGWDVQPPRGAAKGTLADAWEALASSDARAGVQAQGRFLAEPGKAVE